MPTKPRFLEDGQASAHVCVWLLHHWFWQRFNEDRLEGSAVPPRALLLGAGRHVE